MPMTHATAAGTTPARTLLQRKCACGAAASLAADRCPDCERGKLLGLQAKPASFAMSTPGDRFEREADQAAEQVLAGSARPMLTRLPAAPLQREAADAAPVADGVAEAAVQSTVSGGGAPLDSATRGFMEARFGHDFGRVRIHAGAGAAASAQALQARAYTLGRDIVFGAGQYAPATDAGRRLLAHELAHVVQQQATPARPMLMRQANPMQRQFRYDRTEFGGLFDGIVDLDAHRVTLVMRLDVQDQGRPEGKEDRVNRFRARAKAIIEQTWSGVYALQSVCHGSPDKLEARVWVLMTSDAPHREIGLWPDQGERSKSTAWQEGDTEAKERQSPVLIDPKKPPSEKNLRMASFQQTTVAHEFGHLMGLSHVHCDRDADQCYGVTAEQKMDIMGIGSVVSQRDYAPFVRIMERHGRETLPPVCNRWRLVAPG